MIYPRSSFEPVAVVSGPACFAQSTILVTDQDRRFSADQFEAALGVEPPAAVVLAVDQSSGSGMAASLIVLSNERSR